MTIDGARGVTITGVTIQNGPGDGILAIHAATFAVKSTTLQGHGFMGIDVTDQSTAELADVTMQRFGLFCPAGGKLLDPFRRGTFVFRNNRIGMFFDAGCSALVNPAKLTVQRNGTGILADVASTLSFVTDPPNGSEVSGNDTDVNLKFGTRATFQGITIGTIVCDKTS